MHDPIVCIMWRGFPFQINHPVRGSFLIKQSSSHPQNMLTNILSKLLKLNDRKDFIKRRSSTLAMKHLLRNGDHGMELMMTESWGGKWANKSRFFLSLMNHYLRLWKRPFCSTLNEELWYSVGQINLDIDSESEFAGRNFLLEKRPLEALLFESFWRY